MARIRTIKPEFWDSPDTAKAGPWARLCFIALWNWADDYGRGTANMKELEGFIFPNDCLFTDRSGNTVQFRDVAAEVVECFGVVFYEVSGRPYYCIPTWEEHQRNERRAKQSKYPPPPSFAQVEGGVAEMPHGVAEIPCSSGPGTGEEGKRGTATYVGPSTHEEAAGGIPEEWKPNRKHYDYGKEIGVFVKDEAEKFRKDAAAKNRDLKNVNLAFTNWLKQLAPKGHHSTMSKSEAADRLRNPWKYQ